MEKGFRVRRLLLLGCVVPFFSSAQIKSDSIIMTVGEKEVSLAEFEYMAAKNNEIDFADEESLNAYVDLFKNFKLKVADAEAAGFDKASSFISEYGRYEAELTASYMSDQKGQDAVCRMIYDRGNEVLNLSYILFRFPEKIVSKDTVALYRRAYDVYRQIEQGADFDSVGRELFEKDTLSKQVVFEQIHSLLPLKAPKAFDNAAWNLKEGEVSLPVRTAAGYYLIKLKKKKRNLGQVKVAHILFRTDDKADEALLAEQFNLAKEVRQRVLGGEDFAELAKVYSKDAGSAEKGGVLPFFVQGMMAPEFEDGAFQLKKIGEVSEPIKTDFGYHLIKLLDKQERLSFEEEKEAIAAVLKRGEWNFEFYDAFDSRLKKEYNYTFHPEAYEELQQVCDAYFPTDSMFFKSVVNFQDTLFTLNDKVFLQKEFCYYLYRYPFSTKTYSGDFMREVYDLFVRDILTTIERENLPIKYPEYTHLLQEYRDGILLFEISNVRVWQYPPEEQAALEKQWLEEITKKYPVKINTKLLKKIKKY